MTGPRKLGRKFVRSLIDGENGDREAGYSEEEKELLLLFVAELRKDILQGFLGENDLARSGNKREIIERLHAAIESGTLAYASLIELLDAHEPWSKQHIVLMNGPNVRDRLWQNDVAVRAHLKANRVFKYLNERVPLLLPERLRLSSIRHDEHRLRVVAVEKRVAWERDEELDHKREDAEGEQLEFRAFRRRVTRGLMAFEWDLTSNEAFIQVSQLPTHARYEDAIERFTTLTTSWLPLHQFAEVDVKPAIVEFHRLEGEGEGAVRSHRVELVAPDGRRIAGSSAGSNQSLLGNGDIDLAMGKVRDSGGAGHAGNFYLVSGELDGGLHNPIPDDAEVHLLLLGLQNRINIMTPQTEEIVRYALQRVRDACRANSGT